MNYQWYSFIYNHKYIINIILIFILIFTIWNILDEKFRCQIHCKLIKILPIKVKQKRLHINNTFFIKQCCMLFSIIIVNFFSLSVYDDYYALSLWLSIFISIAQILAIIRIFVAKESKSKDKWLLPSFLLGFASIVLAFTHIYFYLFVNLKNGFSNFKYGGMNSNSIDDWLNCFFYSISQIIPYSLTELIPNTYWMKTISLLQVIIFYVFVYQKISIIFKDCKDN